MNTQTLNHPTKPAVLINPFPGLRPFEFDESHLFFGRDGQSERLIAKLASTRFLAVVGTSGSGKSSLVRAGLLPALYSGFMPSAGSAWRIAIMRPGNDPLGNLARALNQLDVFGSDDEANRALQIAITEATLRRGSLGLVEAAREQQLPPTENLLVVADQFEELFRVEQGAKDAERENDRAAFVKLLLAAKAQCEVNIYVVLTMRSDYLGDCAQFWDLPEAINDGQYLIPRLTREQIRAAITGPIFVGGAEATPRLINRLLNDVGDNPDQLPILQHALMRTWDHWIEDCGLRIANANRPPAPGHRPPIDLEHYEAIGGMARALSLHADEAFNQLPDDRHRVVAERVFKALTEKGPDNREIRRPVTLGALCLIADASEAEVKQVLEIFRAPGRSFVMPPVGTELKAESLIDISHECLMREWKRMKDWVEDEARSVRIYRRLAETAKLNLKGEAGLWRDPDLQRALDWQTKSHLNEHWAARYDQHFKEALAFLEKSAEERHREVIKNNLQLQAEEAAKKLEQDLKRRLMEVEVALLKEKEIRLEVEVNLLREKELRLENEQKKSAINIKRLNEEAELKALISGPKRDSYNEGNLALDIQSILNHNPIEFTRMLGASVTSLDQVTTSWYCEELRKHLLQRPSQFPEKEAKRLLQLLRNKRYFELMRQVANAFLQAGQRSPQIRRQYAQALLDLHYDTAALDVLMQLATDTRDDPAEHAEARGLLGRAYKQIYVNAAAPGLPLNQEALAYAIQAYHAAYAEAPARLWHGINTVALLDRAVRDGVAVAAFPNAAQQARELAESILAQISELDVDGKAATWDFATAVEACVALQRAGEAQQWLARYVAAPYTDAFELASTLRQLTEVWQLDMSTEVGQSVLPLLRAELLKREGGSVELSPAELQAERQQNTKMDGKFEKVFGADSYVNFEWYQLGLERCRAVACICKETGEGFGTGFLLKGSDLHESLGEELVLLTNAHVVSNDPAVPGALPPDEAFIAFEALGLQKIEVKELLWTSAPKLLDATLLRLNQKVEGVQPYPLAKYLPLADGKQRLYIVGHPRGGKLSFSLHDNLLLAHRNPLLHYRTPTEGGSSGSPVFNQQWRLVGLHHAGDAQMSRLDGQPGTYEANEGIWINAIKAALATALESSALN
jgi:energy-coupling factor transporter ATP-binding protein EcfA2